MDPLLLLLSGVAIVFVGILFLKLHPFFTLVLAAMFVAAFTSGDLLMEHWMDQGLSEEAARNRANQPFGLRVGLALGETCGKIGIVICMASIIGKCLLDSGAALKIVRSFLRTAGEKRAPAAMGASGFVLGIPVFFDTVFYLLVPLAKALGASTKKNYGLYVLAIIAGGTIAHSQVPPTPGPLFVAEQLNIDIGTMMLGGIIIGSLAATVGMVYAYIVNRKKPIPLRHSGDASEKDLPQWDSIEDDQLPGLWLSLTPIVLPLILLSGKTIFTGASGAMGIALPIWMDRAIQMLGDKNVALTLAASVGLYTLFRKQEGGRGALKEAMQSALASGGIILLITCAGGAFGAMLQQSGIGPKVAGISDSLAIGFLPMAFLLTSLIRTVQGSATVAMITSVGILAPMATPEAMGFHPLYLAMVIGFGSKPFPWMNDSGFWIISKMSGMTEGETLLNFSCMATIMAVAGLIFTVIASTLFPLV